MKYKIIDGKQVPVLPAKAVEIIQHKKTGKVYASKEEFVGVKLIILTSDSRGYCML